jgi:hypothetical protein
VPRALVVALDLHAFGRSSAAGRGEHTLPFDLNHAGPAVAIRPIALFVTEIRDLNAYTLGDLEDGLICEGMDLSPIQGELDSVRHRYKLRVRSHD